MLPREIKDAATAAFRDNARLSEITPEAREQAARWYEQIADQAKGTEAELARLYNLARAKFLRGEIERIAPTAREFDREKGQEG